MVVFRSIHSHRTVCACTQNTQWRRVESVTTAFGDRLTPEAVVDMSEEELEVLKSLAVAQREKRGLSRHLHLGGSPEKAHQLKKLKMN